MLARIEELERRYSTSSCRNPREMSFNLKMAPSPDESARKHS